MLLQGYEMHDSANLRLAEADKRASKEGNFFQASNPMAEFATMLLVLAALASLSILSSSGNEDLATAIEEMRSAGYFSFVMILNMSPPNLIQGNITFLLPNDEALSNNMHLGHGISDFLLRHTIPSPLLFDYLQHIPTDSVLPTLEPGYMVRTDNQGRTSFLLNKVRISNPNVCVAGSSIRCHGIDGVLPAMASTIIPPSTPCSNVSRTGASKSEAPEWASPPSPADSTFPAMLLPASPPNQPQGSESSAAYLVCGVLRSLPAFAFAALGFMGFIHL